jgi:predicted nucleic acid-binding protein
LIVADASVLLDLLLGRPSARRIEAELGGERTLHVPHLLDTEVLHGLRRWVLRGELSPGRASQALDAFGDFPLVRHPHFPLTRRVWALRERLSAYDATYTALAEALGAGLLTGDGRLARGAANLVPVLDVSGA